MALGFLMGYWEYITGFLALFLLAYWTFDEKDQSDSIGDTVERVGERAQSATGGVVGAAGSLMVAIIAVMWTIGDELVMSGMQIAGMLGTDPVLAGGVISALAGTVGLAGIVTVKAWQFGLFAVAVIAVGVIWRTRQNAPA